LPCNSYQWLPTHLKNKKNVHYYRSQLALCFQKDEWFKKLDKLKMKNTPLSVVMLGASGAVGTQALQALMKDTRIKKLTLLVRTSIPHIMAGFVKQHTINIYEPSSYTAFLSGHNTAICTLGVGQPSKVSKEEFIKTDKTAVLDFAKACKTAGVTHFELLASVSIDAQSSSFYLKTKGELVEALKALDFERLSIFEPSMILTPTNRYGILQAITLFFWPLLQPFLVGSARKYRGIDVEVLGKAMAANIFENKPGFEVLQWDDFYALGTMSNI
jgi:uncharacterized protein YbjT (DUF2867 family)